ncbi:unnamed protein product, partial [Closterium sp. NIES-54]
VAAWQIRGRVPASVDVTAGMLAVQLQDPDLWPPNAVPPLPPFVLRQSYAAVIIRFVSGLCDNRNPALGRSVVRVAAHVGIPRLLVDVRHSLAHNRLLQLPVLRLAVTQ